MVIPLLANQDLTPMLSIGEELDIREYAVTNIVCEWLQ